MLPVSPPIMPSRKSKNTAQERIPSSKEDHMPPGHFNGVLINLLKEDDIIASPHSKSTYKNMYKNQKIPLDASKAVSVSAMTGKSTRTTVYMNGTSVTQRIAEDIVTTPETPTGSSLLDFSNNKTTSSVNETLSDVIEGSAESLIEDIDESTETSLMPSTVEADTTQDDNDGETTVLLSGEEDHMATDDKSSEAFKWSDSKPSANKKVKGEQTAEEFEAESSESKEDERVSRSCTT
ncbi:hypothetical protein COOONC_27153 [Cooperia oncophora]